MKGGRRRWRQKNGNFVYSSFTQRIFPPRVFRAEHVHPGTLAFFWGGGNIKNPKEHIYMCGTNSFDAGLYQGIYRKWDVNM